MYLQISASECTVREINPVLKFNSESELFTAATEFLY